MTCQVNAVAGRLSLRSPQRRSLKILDRATEIVPPKKGTDLAHGLSFRVSSVVSTLFRSSSPTPTFSPGATLR